MSLHQLIYHNFEVVCNICRSSSSSSKDPLISCVDCKVYVHPKCYGTHRTLPGLDVWMCDRCELMKQTGLSPHQLGCMFCPRIDGALKLAEFNPYFVQKNSKLRIDQRAPPRLPSSNFPHSQFLVHVNCVNLIPELFYTTKTQDESIEDECKIVNIWGPQLLRQRMNIYCDICGNRNKGYALCCDMLINKKKCPINYHATCAAQKGTLFAIEVMNSAFRDNNYDHFFKLFCPVHIRAKLKSGNIKSVLNDQSIPIEARLQVEDAITRLANQEDELQTKLSEGSGLKKQVKMELNNSRHSQGQDCRRSGEISESPQGDSSSVVDQGVRIRVTRNSTMGLRERIRRPVEFQKKELLLNSEKREKSKKGGKSRLMENRHKVEHQEAISIYSSSNNEESSQLRSNLEPKRTMAEKKMMNRAALEPFRSNSGKLKSMINPQEPKARRDGFRLIRKRDELSSTFEEEPSVSNPYLEFRNQNISPNTLYVGTKICRYAHSDLQIQISELRKASTLEHYGENEYRKEICESRVQTLEQTLQLYSFLFV